MSTSKPKHTPGPWTAGTSQPGYVYATRPDGATVVRVAGNEPSYYMGKPEIEANARLIAASPSLLEACKEALHALTLADSCQDEIDAAKEKILAAVAKAECST